MKFLHPFFFPIFSFFHFLIFLFFKAKEETTALYFATEKGDEQVVQFLLEKGKPNVDLPDKVLLLIVSFFFLFFHFLIFLFFNAKDGATPLCIAAQKGDEQIVQLLLEKGKANVDLADQVILLIVSFLFLFFFHFSHFFDFFF